MHEHSEQQNNGSGEAREQQSIRQALETLARIAGKKKRGKAWVSVDRVELLDLLNAASATGGER